MGALGTAEGSRPHSRTGEARGGLGCGAGKGDPRQEGDSGQPGPGASGTLEPRGGPPVREGTTAPRPLPASPVPKTLTVTDDSMSSETGKLVAQMVLTWELSVSCLTRSRCHLPQGRAEPPRRRSRVTPALPLLSPGAPNPQSHVPSLPIRRPQALGPAVALVPRQPAGCSPALPSPTPPPQAPRGARAAYSARSAFPARTLDSLPRVARGQRCVRAAPLPVVPHRCQPDGTTGHTGLWVQTTVALQGQDLSFLVPGIVSSPTGVPPGSPAGKGHGARPCPPAGPPLPAPRGQAGARAAEGGLMSCGSTGPEGQAARHTCADAHCTGG